MKHVFNILVTLLLATRAIAGAFEETYGIGVVHVSPYNYFTLDFWKKPGDVVPNERIYFYRDTLSPRLHFHCATTGQDTFPAWFAPELFLLAPENSRLDMRCVEKNGSWCKVIVNNNTGDAKWVELGMDVIFLDWNQFFTSVSSVEIIDGKALLYEKPVSKGKSVKLKTKAEGSAGQLLRPLSVQGEWMQVEVTAQDGNGKATKRTGWIRWHDAEKIFISYNLMFS